MTIVYLFAGLILLSVLIAWYSYRTAFYSPEKRKEDDYAIPRGEHLFHNGIQVTENFAGVLINFDLVSQLGNHHVDFIQHHQRHLL